jgi:hypothetical protein
MPNCGSVGWVSELAPGGFKARIATPTKMS